jgi:hypothetical protein
LEKGIGSVENKLLSFPTIQGIVFGSFREASEAVHSLVENLATSRVRVAGPQKGRRGVVRSEEGEVHPCCIYQEDTLPCWPPCSVTLHAGYVRGFVEEVDCSNGEEE